MRLNRTLVLLLLCFPLVFSLVGCQEGDVNVTGPEPAEPGSGGGACTAPSTNNAQIEAQSNGVCPAGGPCLANGTVSQSGAKRTLWTNASCTPKETDSFSPSWTCPSPGTYSFRNILCNSTAAEDPNNVCCRPVDLSITFTEG